MVAYGPNITSVRHQVFAELLQLASGGEKVNFRVVRGSPEGVLVGVRGDVAIDTDGAMLWIKASPSKTVRTSTGWVPVGSIGPATAAEYGSVGWVTEFLAPGVVQTGSGAGLVDVLGPGALAEAAGFSSSGNTLVYEGDGGVFFISGETNLQNPNAEETPFGFQLMLNGAEIVETQRTIILTANAIGAVSTSFALSLATGDVLSAQLGSLNPASDDMTTTYFRLQAYRVAALA
jgi:hypothetical protein